MSGNPKFNYIVIDVKEMFEFKNLRTVCVDKDKGIHAIVGEKDGAFDIVQVHFKKDYFTEEGAKAWVESDGKNIPKLIAKNVEDGIDNQVEKVGGGDAGESETESFTIILDEADGHRHTAKVIAGNLGSRKRDFVAGETIDVMGDFPFHKHEIDTAVWGFISSPGSDGSKAHTFSHPDMVRDIIPPENRMYKYRLFKRKCGDKISLSLRIQTWSGEYVLSYLISEWSKEAEESGRIKQIPIPELSVVKSDWFDFEGTVKAGTPGAGKDDDATYTLIDEGDVQFGYRLPYFHEYFFKGEMLNGKILFNRQGYDESKCFWYMNKPDIQIPDTLIDKSVIKGRVPRKGWSCLPSEWKDIIPKGFRYWEAEDPRIARDMLIQAVKMQKVTDENGDQIKSKTSEQFIKAALIKMNS